jgi:hypothetical protein
VTQVVIFRRISSLHSIGCKRYVIKNSYISATSYVSMGWIPYLEPGYTSSSFSEGRGRSEPRVSLYTRRSFGAALALRPLRLRRPEREPEAFSVSLYHPKIWIV